MNDNIFLVKPTGMKMIGTHATIDDWAEFGTIVLGMHNSSQWATGDWYLWGLEHLGEELWQYIDQLLISRETLERRKRVCQAYTMDERHPNVGFSLHSAAAAVEPKEVRAELLRTAEREGWNRSMMRDAVRQITGADTRDLADQLDESLESEQGEDALKPATPKQVAHFLRAVVRSNALGGAVQCLRLVSEDANSDKASVFLEEFANFLDDLE